MTRKTPKQTAAAFVAVDSRGNFAWGSVRPTPQECFAVIERWNPRVEGVAPSFSIMPIQISYDPSRRLVVQLALELTPMDDPDWL
ncbi:hypothetical protein CNY89_17135, partial [Amaricoccus sp. HAR-UPW-R2A-40]